MPPFDVGAQVGMLFSTPVATVASFTSVFARTSACGAEPGMARITLTWSLRSFSTPAVPRAKLIHSLVGFHMG
jgi:hypothetical protein